jgi:crossover junction endodeoxyribonuclease RuvC
MRYLGIDPGTATTGYGIIDVIDGEMEMVVYGTIETSPKMDMADRLVQIYNEITLLVRTFTPDEAGIEKLFFGKNVTTAITVGQARGVLLLALAQADIPVGEYSPPKIKEAVAGYGSADKTQIQMMVRHLLNLNETPKPDDAADGLAVAITHYHYSRFERLTY